MKTLSMQISTDESKPVDELVKLESIDDVNAATVHWAVGQLMTMENDKRVEICEELIKQCEALKTPPAPLWQQVIDEPQLFDRLAQDHEEGLI